jgi:hypothetical protein
VFRCAGVAHVAHADLVLGLRVAPVQPTFTDSVGWAWNAAVATDLGAYGGRWSGEARCAAAKAAQAAPERRPTQPAGYEVDG